jgi:hypothetical protein
MGEVVGRVVLPFTVVALLAGCERGQKAETAEPPDEPTPLFRNVANQAAYVGGCIRSRCLPRPVASDCMNFADASTT